MSSIDFGLMLQPNPRNFPGSDLFDYNRRLIRALPPGFTTLWVEDHLEWQAEATLECFTTLCYFAAEFPSLRVGSLVLGQAYRNPALLAKMAANLQALSSGRLILGIGAGWKEEEYKQYGYQFPTARARVEQLEEALIIIKSIWSQQSATFHGKYYSIDHAYCEPRPSPSIPLLVGGGGEQRTLGIVARYADWYNFNSCTVEQFSHKITILKQHCAKNGRDPNEIKLTYLGTVSVSADPSRVVRSTEKHYVAGSSADVIHELEQFRAVGVTHFILRFLDIETLAYFGQTVAPHFHSHST